MAKIKPIFLALICVFVSVDASMNWQYGGVVYQPPNHHNNNAPFKPVSLTSVAVHADVRGWAVGVTAELTYVNPLSENIECQFVFPLADNAAIYQLDSVIADRKLSSQVKERKQAEDDYEEAVREGLGAVLMENQVGTADVYRLKLGNLPPNETATITVSYVQPIDRILDDGLLSVTLPVVLNPRYIPGHQISDPEVMKEKFHANVHYVAVSDVQYSMTFDAKISLGLNRSISDLRSGHKSDTLAIVYDDDKLSASVSLQGKFVQDHDFQLLINSSKSDNRPTVYVEPAWPSLPGQANKSWLNFDIAAAWFELEKAGANPSSDSGSNNNNKKDDEYWFVIDRSGSMDDEKIMDAKSALGLFVKSLPFGCKFNIIGFGSSYSVLFQNGPQVFSEETMKTAMAYADGIRADMGGTEILAPLQYIYKQQVRESSSSRRFVVLITDGEVSNTDEVIAIAQQNAATTRVFSIGIGQGASTALVNGVARVSNGLSEFVYSSDDRLSAKVISLLKATTEPSAENVTMHWQLTSGSVVYSVPKELRAALYSGGSTTQFAVIDRSVDEEVKGSCKFSAIVNGVSSDCDLGFQIPRKEFSEANDLMPLHRLAAKMMLTDLIDEFNRDHSEDVRQKAIAVSLATGVLCDLTAFIAVETRPNQQHEDGQTTTTAQPLFIDIQRPSSYANRPNFHRVKRFAFSARSTRLTRGVQLESFHPTASVAWLPDDDLEAAHFEIGGDSEGMMEPTTLTSTYTEDASFHQLSPSKDRFEKLVHLQSFDGSWQLTADFVKLISSSGIQDVDQFRSQIGQVVKLIVANNEKTRNFEPSDDFLATVTAVGLMRGQLAAFKDEWQMIEQKAIVYLQNVCSCGQEVLDVFIKEEITALEKQQPTSSHIEL